MTSFKRWMGCGALLLACGSASARFHQICYEGPPQLKGGKYVSTVIVGCAVDASGSCSITPATADLTARSPAPLDQGVQSGGTFAYFDTKYSVFTYNATVRFFDAVTQQSFDRTCTVSTVGARIGQRGHATPGAVLTGFSTDASGLVTTGVWELRSTTDAGWRRLSVQVPGDFVAVGGGAMGVETPTGAVIMESMRGTFAGDERSWEAGTTQAGGAAQLHRTTAYAIGLRIQDVAPATLAATLESLTAASSPAILSNPTAQTAQPIIGGNVTLSGGLYALADSSNALDLVGQYATMSAPVIGNTLRCIQVNGIFRCRVVPAPVGWRVESKDHVVFHPGTVRTQVLALPINLVVGNTTWEVRGGYVSATSAVTAHPAVDVGGLRGEFALTGVGASVDWRRFDSFGNQIAAGNLLWKLQPRADLGGASVAAKDHIISSPASITGYALGIKLVPVGSP